MAVVAVTLATLLALFVGVLAVPLLLAVDAERAETLEARWRVRWLFGLVDVGASQRRPIPVGPKRPSTAKPPHRASRARRRGSRIGLAVLGTRGLLRRILRLAVTLLRQMRLIRLHVHAAVGFDNPADTGFFYGAISPLLAVADARGLDVHCRPMFPDAGVKWVLRATLRVRPLAVGGSVVTFLLSPPVLRAGLAAWRVRR